MFNDVCQCDVVPGGCIITITVFMVGITSTERAEDAGDEDGDGDGDGEEAEDGDAPRGRAAPRVW